MPYRDAAETVEAALVSVLEQRGPALEVVAIDDGSRDDGPERVRRIGAGIVHVATGGVGIARALAMGLAAARAPVIARMDADDLCLPGRLERSCALLASDARLGVVGTLVEAFPDEAVGEGLRRYVAWMNGLITPEDHALQLFVEAPLCHPSVVLRREALEAVGGWRDVPWPEDYDLWLRLDAAGFTMAKVPEVLLRWRHRPGRLTFSDPRYEFERHREAKAPHLARRLVALGRAVAVWGAGQTGRRVARALEPHGVRAARFLDIDPRKIGGVARGAPICSAEDLRRGEETVVVAVGAPGARDLVRERLDAHGFVEGTDYFCAA